MLGMERGPVQIDEAPKARITLPLWSLERKRRGITSISLEEAQSRVRNNGFCYVSTMREAELVASGMDGAWVRSDRGWISVVSCDGSRDTSDEWYWRTYFQELQDSIDRQAGNVVVEAPPSWHGGGSQ